MRQQQTAARPTPDASDSPLSRKRGDGTHLASDGETAAGEMIMSAHAAPLRTRVPYLRLVHARPAPWIADATLADTRAYVEGLYEAWQALAALSVPAHISAPAAGPQYRQFSIAPQVLPGMARSALSVGGAGLEIA